MASRSARACGSRENDAAQPGAVQGPRRRQHFAPEARDDLVQHGRAGDHDFAGDLVGVDELRAQRDEQLGHSALAAGDAAGQRDAWHTLHGR